MIDIVMSLFPFFPKATFIGAVLLFKLGMFPLIDSITVVLM